MGAGNFVAWEAWQFPNSSFLLFFFFLPFISPFPPFSSPVSLDLDPITLKFLSVYSVSLKSRPAISKSTLLHRPRPTKDGKTHQGQLWVLVIFS